MSRSSKTGCMLILTLWPLLIAITSGQAQSATLTNLFDFTAASGTPMAPLTQGNDGSFYGTTSGTTTSPSSLYKITPGGTLTFLHVFPSRESSPLDGTEPVAPLLQATDGNLYGTTFIGGANGVGTIFKISPAGDFSVLYAFKPTDGQDPTVLIEGADGNFYGTLAVGGPNGTGLIYQITPAGQFTPLYTFTATDNMTGTNAEGAYPDSLVQGSDGNFYGTTVDGGLHANGTVFKMTPGGTLTVLHTFSALSPYTNSDGAYPGSLVQGADGNFYGITTQGGTGATGTVFKITPSGALTTLHEFSSLPGYPDINADGAFPINIVQGADGDFYGITGNGGAYGFGTLFQVTPAGTLAVLYNVTGSNGFAPNGVIQGSDGAFYGTNRLNFGTAFKITFGYNIPDLLLQNPATGQLALRYIDGTSTLLTASIAPIQDPNWTAVGTADFNGDGQPDILFSNLKTGQLLVWFMNGANVTQIVSVTPVQDPAWQVVGLGDFNGDGTPDILFQNQKTGQMAVWFMGGAIGTTALSGDYVSRVPPANWKAVGVADFNVDGHPDILFENSVTGQLAVWYMDVTLFGSAVAVTPTQDPSWQVRTVITLNEDQQTDIVFQNKTSGRIAVWFLTGTTAKDGAFVDPVPGSGWQVVGSR